MMRLVAGLALASQALPIITAHRPGCSHLQPAPTSDHRSRAGNAGRCQAAQDELALKYSPGDGGPDVGVPARRTTKQRAGTYAHTPCCASFVAKACLVISQLRSHLRS